ncbi:hypothetical protein [Chondromyces crocatus]|uniref:hypothetical protein n=1 Tax=Chondromyces crocatus TaxID=52 RepID=UPI0012E1676E|nr:hypothetical protein [Chondromyces crocatus]
MRGARSGSIPTRHCPRPSSPSRRPRERATALPTDDWSRNRPAFQQAQLSQNLKLVERLLAVGARSAQQVGGCIHADNFRTDQEAFAGIANGRVLFPLARRPLHFVTLASRRPHDVDSKTSSLPVGAG